MGTPSKVAEADDRLYTFTYNFHSKLTSLIPIGVPCTLGHCRTETRELSTPPVVYRYAIAGEVQELDPDRNTAAAGTALEKVLIPGAVDAVVAGRGTGRFGAGGFHMAFVEHHSGGDSSAASTRRLGYGEFFSCWRCRSVPIHVVSREGRFNGSNDLAVAHPLGAQKTIGALEENTCSVNVFCQITYIADRTGTVLPACSGQCVFAAPGEVQGG